MKTTVKKSINELLTDKLLDVDKAIRLEVSNAIDKEGTTNIKDYRAWVRLHFGNTLTNIRNIVTDFQLENLPLNIMECQALFNEHLTIDATGDCVQNDLVRFEKAIFFGKYPKSEFSHLQTCYALILNDSYGEKKQQHTFTCLDLETLTTFKVKGRNLYRNGTTRIKWFNELNRNNALDEKHKRGEESRVQRAKRKFEQLY